MEPIRARVIAADDLCFMGGSRGLSERTEREKVMNIMDDQGNYLQTHSPARRVDWAKLGENRRLIRCQLTESPIGSRSGLLWKGGWPIVNYDVVLENSASRFGRDHVHRPPQVRSLVDRPGGVRGCAVDFGRGVGILHHDDGGRGLSSGLWLLQGTEGEQSDPGRFRISRDPSANRVQHRGC